MEHFLSDNRSLRRLLPFLFLALNLVLVWPSLFPALADIESWDESLYIFHGVELAHGTLPTIANKPLSAILYAIIYQFVGHSSSWFVQCCGIGRLVLFVLMWLSALKLADSLRRYFDPLIMPALLLSTNWLVGSIRWAGDSLFSTCACLSLAHTISFQEEKKIKDILLAGLFVGFASLARREGLLLIIPLLISVLLSALPVVRWRKLCFAIVPIFVVLALFTGWHRLRQNDWGWEMPRQQFYEIFEQGQASLLEHPVTGYSGSGNKWREAQRLAEQIYGNMQSNDASVLNAIARNPGMFLTSILRRLALIPHHFLIVTGAVGAAHICLAFRGIVGLIEKREFKVLLLMFAWMLPLLAQITINFAERMVLLDYFVVISLACSGVQCVLKHRRSRNELIGWGFLFAVLLFSQFLLNALAVGVIIFVAALIFTLTFKTRLSEYTKNADGLLILTCVLMYLHGPYLSPVYRDPHCEDVEQANLFMQQKLAPRARIIACAPRDIVAANLEFVNPWTLLSAKCGPQEIMDYLNRSNIEAVYIDDELRRDEPRFCEQIHSLSGHGLKNIYRSSSGSIEIFAR